MPTKIEWTDETWNPITGCTPISEGCRNCYARRMAHRLRGRCGYPKDDPFRVTLHRDKVYDPHGWRKPRLVFVCSMGDLFHKDVPLDWIEAVWSAMVVAEAHVFQVLTKRPARMLEFVTSWIDHMRAGSKAPVKNIWLGVTAENQARADERIPILLKIPAAVRFVSIEPMLEPVELRSWVGKGDMPYLDWVIVGAETGPGKRPMKTEWALDVKRQCEAAGVPFFFKKDSQGRHTLDGKTYEQFPEEATP